MSATKPTEADISYTTDDKMEELLYMIIRGILIGVVVSAPMGPVGIFCIQRTLDKGHLSGFYTGVGAAMSDLIYCLLTGFCLSFIEEFINTNRAPIQFFGACVLIAFGVWLIKKKPSRNVKTDADHETPSREGDILKGFALTFSNPLILFLIIGLFAQFNFVIEDMKFYHYVLGFIGIFAGALGWWWVVTYFVDKLRGHFTRRTMKLINTCVGIIILVFAALGIFSSISMIAAPAQVPRLKDQPRSLVAEFRVADTAMKGWSAEFVDSLDAGFIVSVKPQSTSDPFGDNGGDVLAVTVTDRKAGEVLATAIAKEGVDPYRGNNSWQISRTGDSWQIRAGNREYRQLLDFTFDMGLPSAPSVTALPKGEIEVSLFHMDVAPERVGASECRDITALWASLDGRKTDLPGIYSLFDYVQDDSYAVVGGNYRVALTPSDSIGEYALVYLGGARTLSDCWRPGMRKGHLRPTPFANLFDVEWVDAEGDVMAHDVQAEFDPLSQTLTVQFPYQGSSLRFRKE